MDFVADESCAASVIRALRNANHNVLAIAEVARGATDEKVLKQALETNRLLITEDRDFGELVFARGIPTAGVILVRIPNLARLTKPATVVEAITRLGSRFGMRSP